MTAIEPRQIFGSKKLNYPLSRRNRWGKMFRIRIRSPMLFHWYVVLSSSSLSCLTPTSGYHVYSRVSSFRNPIIWTNRLGIVDSNPRSFAASFLSSSSSSSQPSLAEEKSEEYSSAERITQMRVTELKDELKRRNVSFADCFDKESLVIRLRDAIRNEISVGTPNSVTTETSTTDNMGTSTTPSPHQAKESKAYGPRESSPRSVRELSTEQTKDLLHEIKSMSVKELRTELANRRIRWAGLIEKEDLVQALFQAKLKCLTEFSITGQLIPGSVVEISGDTLRNERKMTSSVPMLLDVYATWCGPCKIVSPQIQAVAEELGDRLRVVKMDSDKEAEVSAELRVHALPTLILFDASGNEIDRKEGAMMKEQILQWISTKI